MCGSQDSWDFCPDYYLFPLVHKYFWYEYVASCFWSDCSDVSQDRKFNVHQLLILQGLGEGSCPFLFCFLVTSDIDICNDYGRMCGSPLPDLMILKTSRTCMTAPCLSLLQIQKHVCGDLKPYVVGM